MRRGSGAPVGSGFPRRGLADLARLVPSLQLSCLGEQLPLTGRCSPYTAPTWERSQSLQEQDYSPRLSVACQTCRLDAILIVDNFWYLLEVAVRDEVKVYWVVAQPQGGG